MQRSGAGIALLLVGVAIFSVRDIIVRELSGIYPIMEFVFFRTLFSIPFVLIIAFMDAGVRAFRPRRPALHVLRATLMFMAYTTYFLAVASVPLATAVALFFASPILATALAVGFGGVLFILQPGAEAVDPGGLIGVLSALIYAFSIVLTRKIGASEPASSLLISQTFVYFAVSGMAGALMRDIPVPPDAHSAVGFLLREWAMPILEHTLLLAGCGIIAAIAFYCLTQAYRIASPAVVAPFEQSGMLWGVTWGFLFWREVPNALAFSGMAVILASGIYIMHREAVRARTTMRPVIAAAASRHSPI